MELKIINIPFDEESFKDITVINIKDRELAKRFKSKWATYSNKFALLSHYKKKNKKVELVHTKGFYDEINEANETSIKDYISNHFVKVKEGYICLDDIKVESDLIISNIDYINAGKIIKIDNEYVYTTTNKWKLK